MGASQQKVDRQPFENINRIGVSLAQKVLPFKMKEDEFEEFLHKLTKKCGVWSWCAPIRQYLTTNRKTLYQKYCDHLKTNCLTAGLAESKFDLTQLESIFTQNFKQEVRRLEEAKEGIDCSTFKTLLSETKAFLALIWYIQKSVKQLVGKQNSSFKASAASLDIPSNFECVEIPEECFRILIQLSEKILKPTITELEKAIKEKKFDQPEIKVLEEYKKAFKYLYEFRRPTISSKQKQKFLMKIYENVPEEKIDKIIPALIQRFGVADYYCDLFVLSELGVQDAWSFRLQLEKPIEVDHSWTSSKENCVN